MHIWVPCCVALEVGDGMSIAALHDRTGLDQQGATRESTRGIVGWLELCMLGNVSVHAPHVCWCHAPQSSQSCAEMCKTGEMGGCAANWALMLEGRVSLNLQ